MAGQYARYPNPSISSNPSIGSNNAAIPTSSTLVGGSDGADLIPISVDATGKINVVISSIPVTHVIVDSGSITANAGTNLNTSALALEATQLSMSAKLPATLGQKAMAASMAVVLASDQSSIPVAATLQASSAVIGHVIVDSGSVTANAGTNLNTSALNLEATQSAMSAKLPATLGQKAMAASLAVVLASDQASVPVAATLQAGSAIVGKVGIDQTTPGTTNGVQVNSALPAGTNIIGYEYQAPNSGSTNALSRVASSALEASHVIKASAGRLYLLLITNTKSSAQFIQIHNSTTVPADTAVPVYSFYVPAQSSISLDETLIGDYFSTGIAVCNSSTVATKTVGSADCWFVGLYL